MKIGAAKTFWAIGVAELVVAASCAGLMIYVAWEHNPQGAFHELSVDGIRTIHWSDWIAVGASWFIPVVVSVTVLGLVLRGVASLARRRAV